MLSMNLRGVRSRRDPVTFAKTFDSEIARINQEWVKVDKQMLDGSLARIERP